MDHITWRSHIQQRTDFATRVTHLTRSSEKKCAYENLIKILEEKMIHGSTTDSGFIVGNNSAVCFQDVPLLCLAENLEYEKTVNSKTRYEGYGLRFNKIALYKKGARPVLYGKTQELKKLLPETEYWRIVNHDLSNQDYVIDWTHEREWRFKGSLPFEYKDIEILVYSDNDYQSLVKYFQHSNPDLLHQIHGIILGDKLISTDFSNSIVI